VRGAICESRSKRTVPTDVRDMEPDSIEVDSMPDIDEDIDED
jgi:hypothetical protein